MIYNFQKFAKNNGNLKQSAIDMSEKAKKVLYSIKSLAVSIGKLLV